MWWTDYAGWYLLWLLIFLIVYWALLILTIVDMVRHNANTVMLVFTSLSLAILPPLVISGILWIITWQIYKARAGVSARA